MRHQKLEHPIHL